MRAAIVVTARVVAALALLVLGLMAADRSTLEVTVRFPAAETRGLSQDLVFECGGTTSFDSNGGSLIEGGDAYQDWVLTRAKQAGGTMPDTGPERTSACDEARDTRLIGLVWLVAGALAAGVVLLTVARIPRTLRT